MSKNTNKQPLIKRVHRFLSHFARPIRRIPVHPSDLLVALQLRRLGVIPNLPINVLGGQFYPKIINNNQGAK